MNCVDLCVNSFLCVWMRLFKKFWNNVKSRDYILNGVCVCVIERNLVPNHVCVCVCEWICECSRSYFIYNMTCCTAKQSYRYINTRPANHQNLASLMWVNTTKIPRVITSEYHHWSSDVYIGNIKLLFVMFWVKNNKQ